MEEAREGEPRLEGGILSSGEQRREGLRTTCLIPGWSLEARAGVWRPERGTWE